MSKTQVIAGPPMQRLRFFYKVVAGGSLFSPDFKIKNIREIRRT